MTITTKATTATTTTVMTTTPSVEIILQKVAF